MIWYVIEDLSPIEFRAALFNFAHIVSHGIIVVFHKSICRKVALISWSALHFSLWSLGHIIWQHLGILKSFSKMNPSYPDERNLCEKGGSLTHN